jgi:DNA excision repair protein ERCC-5
MAAIERLLTLTRVDLVFLAQLLGSDYAHGVTGIGPVLAMEILAEFKGTNNLYFIHISV